MGTRSLTHIKDFDGETITTIYRQFDSYPSGLGQELADFCAARKIVNGIGAEDTEKNSANRMGCFAAQLIAYLKDSIGNVELEKPDTSDCWEEYTYTIYPDGPMPDAVDRTGPRSRKLKIKCNDIFDDYADKFDGEKLEGFEE